MEAVGAGASILTFVTVAFSVSKSIHDTLSSIRDGPEVLRFLKDELSQLQDILQGLLHTSITAAGASDVSELLQLVKKCQDDLVGFNASLCQFNISGTNGRRGRLWRKLKLAIEEKDLDHIREVIKGHVQLLTLRLSIIQAQQLSLTAEQSVKMLSILQQIQQSVRTLQVTESFEQTRHPTSTSVLTGVTEPDDAESPVTQKTTLEDSIKRMMRLVDKKTCVVESNESEDLLDNLEQILRSVQNDLTLAGNNCHATSRELNLMKHVILSSPSIIINHNAPPAFFDTRTNGTVLSQDWNRRTVDNKDGKFIMTTVKRHQMLFSTNKRWEIDRRETESLANLSCQSKKDNKILTLSVSQSHVLFERFTSMLPRVIVSNILPKDSHVFKVVREGSVEDLKRMIVGGKASIHDRDILGWSLLYYAVSNLPMLSFLIDQGLDVNEVSTRGGDMDDHSVLHFAVYGEHDSSVVALLQAGADPTIKPNGNSTCLVIMLQIPWREPGEILHKALRISPFIGSHSDDEHDTLSFCLVRRWTVLSKAINPFQERKTVDLLQEFGYSIGLESNNGPNYRHINETLLLSDMVERRDLIEYLMNRAYPFPTLYDNVHILNWAYKMCNPCHLSKASMWDDIWDTVLERLGYDLLRFRKAYPRRARYNQGYTREHFETLWRGREGHCPYWNDDLWPPFASEEDVRASEIRILGQTCDACKMCEKSDFDCYNCGVCLLQFRYSCYEPHHHDKSCPRTRVGYWECSKKTGFYEFTPREPNVDLEEVECPSAELMRNQRSDRAEYEEDLSEDGSQNASTAGREEKDSLEEEPGHDSFRLEDHEELYDNPWTRSEDWLVVTGM